MLHYHVEVGRRGERKGLDEARCNLMEPCSGSRRTKASSEAVRVEEVFSCFEKNDFAYSLTLQC